MIGAFKTALTELIGLFVEDGSFAIAIALWLLICGLVLPRIASVHGWQGPTLFAGLAIILVANVRRAASQ